MLPALARTWKASKLRHNTPLTLLEKLRYFTSSVSLSSQENQNEQKHPSPAIATTPQADYNLLLPPTEPGPEECCGKGCEECVWTAYWHDLRKYQITVAEAQGIERPLDPFEVLERRLAEQLKNKKEKEKVP